jgi:hypothetical protein
MTLKKEKVEQDLSVSTSHIDNDDSEKNMTDSDNEDNDSSNSDDDSSSD